MTVRRWLLLACVLIGIVGFNDAPRAQGPAAAFHAVGFLPGARAASMIRDATRVGGVIHAVGGAAARPCTGTSGICGETDTAVLWKFDGSHRHIGGASRRRPNTTSTAPLSATPSRLTPPLSPARRGRLRLARTVTRPRSNQSSSVSYSERTASNQGISAAVAIASNDGAVLYGSTSLGTIALSRGFRFDPLAVLPNSVVLPLVAVGDNQNPVAERGTSANGSVAVGSSFSTTSNHKAYRYVHGRASLRSLFSRVGRSTTHGRCPRTATWFSSPATAWPTQRAKRTSTPRVLGRFRQSDRRTPVGLQARARARPDYRRAARSTRGGDDR